MLSKWVPYLHRTRNNASMNQSFVWSCSGEIKRISCIVDMWQWIKYRSTTTHTYQKNRQLSEQQLMKLIQSDQKLLKSASKIIVSIFWDTHGILFLNYLEKAKTINREYNMTLLNSLKKSRKKGPICKRKSTVQPG